MPLLEMDIPRTLQAALGIILIIDLGLLATERQIQCIRLLALQGLILGLLPLLGDIAPLDWHLLALTAIFLMIKAVVLPHVLRRCHATLPQSPPLTPYIGYNRSVLAGSLGCAFSLWLAVRLPVPANPLFLAFFAPAVTTVLAGLLVIVTRRKILTQVMGYLVLENGIYLLGVPLARQDAAWLELSVLLDVFVGIFVMIIAVRHLNEAFHSVDVDRIASLRD
ncbi:putative hydrogenase-4 component E [uncultured delta proteobacterium]|uniref:Putative hydrogenase-4 component E n=1 Tax=uncultured delta proteobacterium TaxID=34034 RepID=A0A212KHH5_9DELT|nr:putative hydrogenase-4 component E [uncultured delta proteobacterium]